VGVACSGTSTMANLVNTSPSLMWFGWAGSGPRFLEPPGALEDGRAVRAGAPRRPSRSLVQLPFRDSK
jgi:hypothetical protein